MFKKYILLLVLILAFALRFWRLGDYPALNADEASIGYNAYSLIETGDDEHSSPWPIHFQSFNDYKPGLYFYLVLPFVKFLGLNEWAVRIPGAFLGVLTVFVVYLLIKELNFENSLKIRNLKLEIGEIAAFFLAISPWHIHFSRGGWEVNVATFFIVLGILLFLKAKNNLPVLMLSSLSFILSLYTYHAARIISPLMVLGLVVIYRSWVREYFKNFLLVFLIGLVALMPLIKDFTGNDIFSRAAGVGIFADTGPLSRINEQRGEHERFTSFTAKVFHNKVINYSLAFLENWSDHFHGEFLFLSGDVIQRNRVPEMGEMYMIDFVFLVFGLVFLLKSKTLNNESKSLILWWLIVSPTASALTFQSPHALRAQNMVIPAVIISSVGLAIIIDWLNGLTKHNWRLLGLIVVGLIISWNFLLYQHNYWIHMAKAFPFSSQYGVKELVDYLSDNMGKYEKVLVTDHYDQPYILFLFYLRYPPEKFQVEHELSVRDKFGFSTVRNFDKFEFRPINWDSDQPINPNSLIIGIDEEIPQEANIVKEIFGSNGHKYFEVVAN